MRKIIWASIAVLGLVGVLTAGCGPKGGHEMSGKSISTEKLDVTVFGKGDAAKYCPVMGTAIPKGKGLVYTLKDGKRIKLCCAACISAVEKDLEKYKEFYY